MRATLELAALFTEAGFPAGVLENDRPIDLAVLADAAAAVFALPDLRGRSADATRARRGAIHVVGPEVPSKVVADCLGIKPRAVQVLRTQTPEPLVVRAVHQQALLRTSQRLFDVA